MLLASANFPPRPEGKALVRKLERAVPLNDADRALLAQLGAGAEDFPADVDIVHEGQKRTSIVLLTEGFACRYRTLRDGRRQVMTFLLPGDFCDAHGFLVGAMDHSICTLRPSKITQVPHARVLELVFGNPRIAAALWWSSMQEQAILRERTVALGRRRARGRVAYLLCELWWRYESLDLAQDHSMTLPLTQVEIADAIGLTPAHVNRVLMTFRDEELIALAHRRLQLLDLRELTRIADFTSDYLHFEGVPAATLELFGAAARGASKLRLSSFSSADGAE